MKNKLNNLISNTKFIVLFGIIIRFIIVFNFTGWLHDDEVFQSMDIAYSIIYGEEIEFVLIPYEFRDVVRSYIWPIILVPWVYTLIQFGFNGKTIYLITRLTFSLIGMLPILLFKPIQVTDKKIYRLNLYHVLFKWIIAFYLPWIFLNFHINPDGIAATLCLFIILSEYVNSSNENRISKILNSELFKLFLIGFIIAIRPQYVIILIPVIVRILNPKKMKIKKLASKSLILFLGFLPRLIVDWIYYGNGFLPLINFFIFNVVEQDNVIYSILPWWFYPLEFSFLVYVFGIMVIVRYGKQVMSNILDKSLGYREFQFITLWMYIFVFQNLKHKEPRFIVLPTILIFIISLIEYDPLQYLKKISHKDIKLDEIEIYQLNFNKEKIRIFIFFILILPLLIFPTHIQDSLWKAQNYANSIDPTGKKVIYANQFAGGGNLLNHHPTGTADLIFVGLSSTNDPELATYDDVSIMIFENSTYISVDKINMLLGYCTNPIFIKTFSDTPHIFNYALEVTSPNKIRDYSVWSCNFY